jgi:hypothetical protein
VVKGKGWTNSDFEKEIEGKRPLGKPRSRWENRKKVGISRTGWSDMDGIHLAQERNNLKGCCEHGNEHWSSNE